jgi:hypothetical protein
VANANPGTKPTESPTDDAEEFSSGTTDNIAISTPVLWDRARADKMLAVVSAGGYRDNGLSVNTVTNNAVYPTEESAKEAGSAAKALLMKIAPEGKNVGLIVGPKQGAANDDNGFGWTLYLKPKGAPRGPRKAKEAETTEPTSDAEAEVNEAMADDAQTA